MKPANPRILTINGGSSSIRFALFEAGDSLRRILGGSIGRTGHTGVRWRHRRKRAHRPHPSVLSQRTSLEAAVDKNVGNPVVISEVASDESVPAPFLSAALYERFSTPSQDDFADKLLPALHYLFGGHEEKAASKEDGD
jgi:hypothetical protein